MACFVLCSDMHYVVSAACMEYDALDSFIVNTFIDNIPVFLIPFIESPAKTGQAEMPVHEFLEKC